MDFNIYFVALFVNFLSYNIIDGKQSSNALKVLTYNVALHEIEEQFSSTREVRKKKIIRALKKSDADVVCLQEVYIGQDVEDIASSLKKQFPYSFSEMHTAINKFPKLAGKKTLPPCDYTRMQEYLACVKDSGCSPENITCKTTQCPNEAGNIFQNDDQDCLTCIATSLVNEEKCTAKKPVIGGRQVNNGGLLLLSKRKFHGASFKDYHRTTRESYVKGYIKATIRKFAELRCTQLYISKSDIYFEPQLINIGFTTLEELNKYQSESLIKSLKKNRPALLLGDFNTGIALKSNLVARAPENYLALMERFTTRPAIGYTYKDFNDESNRSNIDHVFVRNLIMGKSERVFVAKKGEPPMSDHVGVQTVVIRPC